MKKYLIVSLILCSTFCNGQFHVRVVANPSNDGLVNPAWLNNYIVVFTNNDWKTSDPIKCQETWSGFDDNSVTFDTSEYDVPSFQKQPEAISFAKQFKNIDIVRKYLYEQYVKNLKLDKEFKAQNKKLCFGCKKVSDKKVPAKEIY